MEERQKVYIRGVLGRGEEVIQKLIDLGGVNRCSWNGECSHVSYFIAENGNIGVIGEQEPHYENVIGSLKEIKLDEQPTENEDDFFTSFLKYLRETPDEQLLKDWNEHSDLDLIGTTIKEFMEQLNKPRELRKDVLYEHKCKESSSGYSHEGKYHITDFVRCKDCSTGEWYDAVEYCKQECTGKYVRAKHDFIEKFKECRL